MVPNPPPVIPAHADEDNKPLDNAELFQAISNASILRLKEDRKSDLVRITKSEIAETQEKLNGDIASLKKDLIQILGIFAAMVVFSTGSLQLILEYSSLEAGFLIVVFAGALYFFAACLRIVFEGAQAQIIKTVIHSIVSVALISLGIAGLSYTGSGENQGWTKDAKDQIEMLRAAQEESGANGNSGSQPLLPASNSTTTNLVAPAASATTSTKSTTEIQKTPKQ